MAKKSIDVTSYNYRLGQNIARLRHACGYPQTEMEWYTGISRAYYGRIELGLHSPTIDMIVKIAEALNVPVYKLFQDEDGKPLT